MHNISLARPLTPDLQIGGNLVSSLASQAEHELGAIIVMSREFSAPDTTIE